ncbi:MULTISPECIES: hypothetical protein [Rhizobium]|uniref:Uncharacterized protein n=1 Tax=Rhizobium esperanzae TaxID=1967781 RepID=A0A7W6XZA6_9HYPH|nr:MULTISPECIES: hypothetical protein [Rhizobium]MBB4443422.1 hypothetical protein [Rhizobium esperanzae]MBY5508377.1 hypothetical protein [Rhizobium leguminosarum]MDH6202919.1 hypothetical protein [Rhizobium leguminosarum]
MSVLRNGLAQMRGAGQAALAWFGIRTPLIATALFARYHGPELSADVVGATREGLYYVPYASLGTSFVQSQAEARPAYATAIYWNTIVISGGLAGPSVGIIARAYGFRTVIEIASLVAIFAAAVLLFSLRRFKVSTGSPP